MIGLWTVIVEALRVLGMSVLHFFGPHFLTALVFLPVAAAVLVVLIPREQENGHKLIGFVSTTALFLLSLATLAGFRDTQEMQFQQMRPWIPSSAAIRIAANAR